MEFVLAFLVFFVLMSAAIYPVYLPALRARRDKRKKAKALGSSEVQLLDRWYTSRYSHLYNNEARTSKAGYTVAEAFRDIPQQYRPFSGNELVRTLQALDLKWGDRKDNHAFEVRYFEENFEAWFWKCECANGKWKTLDSKHNCKLFDDYGRLVWEFTMIRAAAERQEREFKLAGRVEGNPDHLNLLLTRAREESTIITAVTNELLGQPASIDDSAHLTSVATRMRELIKAKL